MAGHTCEGPPPLHKPLTIYPLLSDLRQSLLPPFVPPRAQEFPTLPSKPPRALPEAEEDKEFSETKELLKQTHAQYTESASWRKPPRGASPRLEEKQNNRGTWNSLWPFQ